MRKEEVPQDSMDYRQRGELKKVVYAKGKDGSYEGVSSAGWEPENIATRDAWALVEEELEALREGIGTGKKSPLEYYMRMRLMDVALLAKYTNQWAWRVKRHLKPSVFRKLRPEQLARYAEALAVSVEELQRPTFED